MRRYRLTKFILLEVSICHWQIRIRRNYLAEHGRKLRTDSCLLQVILMQLEALAAKRHIHCPLMRCRRIIIFLKLRQMGIRAGEAMPQATNIHFHPGQIRPSTAALTHTLVLLQQDVQVIQVDRSPITICRHTLLSMYGKELLKGRRVMRCIW